MGRTQKEFADALAGELNLSILTSRAYLERFLQLVETGRVELRGMGIFQVHSLAPREIMHPGTGQTVTIPARKELMQKYGLRAGVPKERLRFHALRHSIAVHLLDAGADVAFVCDRLGHANIQNTQLYLRYTTATRDFQTRRLFSSPHVV